MDNQRSSDIAPQSLDGPSTPSSGVPLSNPSLEQPTQAIVRDTEYIPLKQRQGLGARLRLIIFSVAALLLVGGMAFAILQRATREAQVQAGNFKEIHIPLANLTTANSTLDTGGSLIVNGRLQVANSMILVPTSQPNTPIVGQIYYDKDTNFLTYYNGQELIRVGAGAGTNVTNLLGGGGGVLLQATTPGTQQTGNFNISGTGRVGNLSAPLLTSPSGGIVAQANSFQVQNSAGQSLLNVDAAAGNISLLAPGAGSNALSIATAASTGVSGTINITTGASSTTASGNINIDTGSGIIDGEVVGTKTFESGVDNMIIWFGSTIAQTTAQAHTGTGSLEMTSTAAFWGVQENINNPITPVVPGHNYHFSLWVRAATTPRTITSLANWVGGAGGSLNLQVVVDTTTGWTEVTGNGIAPAGSTGVYPTMQGIGVPGEIHYFDDVVITDLSSSSAASTIGIGETNAKIITIGNINQIGATSILGGSGINLSSGVSGITMNGGSIILNASATSSFGTSKGALTLTSAATARWGISTATSGVGGNLSINAGGGGTDSNNNGGDLILQGGEKNGTGLAGSVIVKPPTDVTDAFIIQNSAGIGFFTADSSGMNIIVSGTDTTYATLTLTDAHFKATQTTAPTIGTPINCGTSPVAAVTAASTDSAGSFTITTGTGGTSSTCDTIFTFNKTYGAAPKSILVVGKTTAASAARQPYVAAVNATTFTLSFGVSTGGADSTTYSFSYWVIE